MKALKLAVVVAFLSTSSFANIGAEVEIRMPILHDVKGVAYAKQQNQVIVRGRLTDAPSGLVKIGMQDLQTSIRIDGDLFSIPGYYDSSDSRTFDKNAAVMLRYSNLELVIRHFDHEQFETSDQAIQRWRQISDRFFGVYRRIYEANPNQQLRMMFDHSQVRNGYEDAIFNPVTRVVPISATLENGETLYLDPASDDWRVFGRDDVRDLYVQITIDIRIDQFPALTRELLSNKDRQRSDRATGVADIAANLLADPAIQNALGQIQPEEVRAEIAGFLTLVAMNIGGRLDAALLEQNGKRPGQLKNYTNALSRSALWGVHSGLTAGAQEELKRLDFERLFVLALCDAFEKRWEPVIDNLDLNENTLKTFYLSGKRPAEVGDPTIRSWIHAAFTGTPIEDPQKKQGWNELIWKDPHTTVQMKAPGLSPPRVAVELRNLRPRIQPPSQRHLVRTEFDHLMEELITLTRRLHGIDAGPQ